MSPYWIELIRAYGVVGIILGAMIFEDVTLLMAVGFVQSGAMTMNAAFWGIFLGLNLGNWLVYSFGYAASFPSFPWQSWAARIKIYSKKMAKAHDLMIFLARFVPGTRVPVYALAGFTKYSARKFFVLNFVSAAIWGGLVLWLGERIFLALKENWIWELVGVVLVLIISKFLLKKIFHKNVK